MAHDNKYIITIESDDKLTPEQQKGLLGELRAYFISLGIHTRHANDQMHVHVTKIEPNENVS